MEVYIRSMDSLGMTVPSQSQLAADFLDKLNDQLEHKRSVLLNNCRLNGNFPKTLFEAYKIITELSEPAVVSVASASVFNVNKSQSQIEENNEKGNEKGGEGESKGNGGGGERKGHVVCYNCGEVGHKAFACPDKKASPGTKPTPSPSKEDSKKKTSKVNFTQAEVMEFFGFHHFLHESR